MKDLEVKILENREIIKNHYLLTAKGKESLPRFSPGQFVMVRIDEKNIFLRRPFSVYAQDGDTLSIMYKVRGIGTNILSKMKKGKKISLLGPLGRGFTLKERDLYVVVAGGIGIAGVNLLIERIRNKIKLFYGTSSSYGLSLLGNLMVYKPFISTMDGSYGYKGDVISCLREYINEFKDKNVEIFACGPKEMYKSLKDALLDYSLPCQVLCEERMACGMGLCFGCVIETNDKIDPMKRVCFEGPVFDLWDLSL